MQHKWPQDSRRETNTAAINTVREDGFNTALIQTLKLFRGNRQINNNSFQRLTQAKKQGTSGFKLQGIFQQLAGTAPHGHTKTERLLNLPQNIFGRIAQLAR